MKTGKLLTKTCFYVAGFSENGPFILNTLILNVTFSRLLALPLSFSIPHCYWNEFDFTGRQ